MLTSAFGADKWTPSAEKNLPRSTRRSGISARTDKSSLIAAAYSMSAMPDSDKILQRSEMSRWAKLRLGRRSRDVHSSPKSGSGFMSAVRLGRSSNVDSRKVPPRKTRSSGHDRLETVPRGEEKLLPTSVSPHSVVAKCRLAEDSAIYAAYCLQ